MSGDVKNASIWANADVYIGTLAAANPATVGDAFSVDWSLVGLLDGSAGFEHARDEDVSDHFAWGGILVATARKNFKDTRKFTALEDNAVTRSVIWPGSDATQLVVPRPSPVKLALETRTGGKVKRLITKNYALITLDGGFTDNEDDLTKYPLLATIYPDASVDPAILWVRQAVPDIASIAITPLTKTLAVGAIGKLVATATYTDATTADISATAAWYTSNAAKATVDKGYVTAVATGSASISCALGGITSTAPSVITVS